jgi:hypothetical protein
MARSTLQFRVQITKAFFLCTTINVNERELPQIIYQSVTLFLQLGNGVLAHRLFHFFEPQPKALLLGTDCLPANTF